MSDITYPLFPIVTALGFVIVLIPLPWHLEAWNSGTCYYMIWVALACLNQFVNSVVWTNDALNRAPIWCDISTRITLGAAVGIPASSLCIMRRLYNISKVQAVATTRAEKRRAVLVDTLICVLFPIIEMVLAYIVQGHRFDIFEQVGCYPHIVNMLPAYFLVVMWPVVIGMISAIYCGLTLWSFLQRQAQFSQFMSSNSSLTMSRYFRLMALAGVELLCTTPLSVFLMVLNLTAQPLDPWVSWQDTHYNFSRVRLVPAVFWTMNRWLVVGIQVNRWSGPFCAFIFFAFFGFAAEARKNYRNTISKVFAFCRLKRDPLSPQKTSPGSVLCPIPAPTR
ncbi:fungal pheromone STE3G-protein-coupled receptor [Thelephora ganbajun]|uniref:Fungal pheromone STE3G-protein-coupled receptor n=1 Tax=Thelephora ganbajun TaxID=370292 RepID=A0ACB6ZIY0_THEGA|nr:fungal pheromone STE3G-protein-coupled receptor [Thelephora ganbajun]